MSMGRQAKTQRIIDEAYEILADFNPMTVRQVYYQLVSRQVVENNRGAYQGVSDALVAARREETIPWEWIEDRLRQPRGSGDGSDISPSEFLERDIEMLGYGYRKAIWPTQDCYIEAWVEKDALSGIFEEAVSAYNIVLNVGRGYDGWSSIRNAADRFLRAPYDRAKTILYFGDFDPSGEDMVRSLGVRLEACGACPTIVKVALTLEDIERYSLPPNFTKRTDTRREKFVERFGDVSVELDALPPAVLQARIVEAVEQHMDMAAYRAVKEQEQRDRDWLSEQAEAIRQLIRNAS